MSWFILEPTTGLMDGYYAEESMALVTARGFHQESGGTFIVAECKDSHTFGDPEGTHFPDTQHWPAVQTAKRSK